MYDGLPLETVIAEDKWATLKSCLNRLNNGQANAFEELFYLTHSRYMRSLRRFVVCFEAYMQCRLIHQ